MKQVYFYCYSYKLMNFLKLQGHHFICKARHPNGNPYWIFQNLDGELDSSLQKWNEYKAFLQKEGTVDDRETETIR